jgi:glycosyltransferase involved in cell wall biosynthesis
MEELNHNNYKVSVIIPVYNDKRGIKKCLKSLLEQNYNKELYEIIIIDNGSTDGTKEFLKKSPVIFLEKNDIQSSYASRNKGIKQSKNEILCFTDSDVIVDKNWIKNGVKSLIELKKKGKNGVIFGKICLIGDPYQNIYTLYDYATNFRNLLATNNIFTYKEIFKKVGYFNHTIISGGDNEWGERVLNNGYVIEKVDDVIIYHPLRNDFRSHYRRRIRIGYGKGQTGYKHYGKTIRTEYGKEQIVKNYGDSFPIFQIFNVLLNRLKIQLQLIIFAFNLIRKSEQKKISILKFITCYIPIVLFFNFLTGYGTFLQKIGKKFNR